MCPILIAEDTAYQQNSYVSPAFGRRHLAPLWHPQALAARQDGASVFFHSDGNSNHFLPLIVEAGFDGLQGIEPAAGMDICGIRQTYIRSLCLMGNLNPALFSDSSVEGDGREISARPGNRQPAAGISGKRRSDLGQLQRSACGDVPVEDQPSGDLVRPFHHFGR